MIMAKKKYYSMNEVPIGTEMKVKKTEEIVRLIEIQNFPTTFLAENSSGLKEKYLTHEVEILNWPENND